MKIGFRSCSDLLQDHFSSPTLYALSGYLLLEIDLSPSETQVYIVDINRSELILENELWVNEQVNIVQSAIDQLSSGLIALGRLTNKTVLLGVWHFGHLLGDHAHQLIRDSLCDHNNTLHEIHISSCFSGINNISELLHIENIKQNMLPQAVYANPIRIYSLHDCICRFPAANKSIPLSVACSYLERALIPSQNTTKPIRVFLTSGRISRIKNLENISKELIKMSWIILNPLLCKPHKVLETLANADVLVSENGSILFNCFLSRQTTYVVLASNRCHLLTPRAIAGGAVYNAFHKDILRYLYCPTIKARGHPFSDQIEVPLKSLLDFVRR